MKSLKKLMLLSVAFLSSAIVLCNANNAFQKVSAEGEEQPARPIAFVLTGQSNMEGNTRFSKNDLTKVFSDLSLDDTDCCFDGIPEVRTSYYGCGYGQIYTESNVHASNNVSGHKIDGKFLDTKTGMGNSNSSIGPELGAAYVLRKFFGTQEQPIYFIKCGVSGSGFDQKDSQGSKVDWNVEKEESLYSNILKPYTTNCLNLIEEEAGAKPIIQAFLWNQGESDSDSKNNKIEPYNDRFNALVGKFKDDFADYSMDGNKDNIAVIDALIFEEGKNDTKKLNDKKVENCNAHDNYYYVDATKREGGLSLSMGSDNLHYDLKSMVRLGMAYGEEIIKSMASFEVTKPKKTKYKIGDEIKVEGLALKVNFSNGYSLELTEDDYEVQEVDMSEAGEKEVQINTQFGVATFTIKVSNGGCAGSLIGVGTLSASAFFAALLLILISQLKKKKYLNS